MVDTKYWFTPDVSQNEEGNMWDILFEDATLACMNGAEPYGLIENGAIAIRGDKIDWVGPVSEIDVQKKDQASRRISLNGKLITPGLIDCHTHLVYGGSRADEFEMRLNGASYEEIARKGGGIKSTVAATRSIDETTLLEESRKRLQSLSREGVTTLEIKSGYGLDLETECKMLRVARKLGEQESVNIQTTFLGAHALPVEYSNRADDYITFVCKTVLPYVAEKNLADAVDAFCEGIGFSPAQVERVFKTALSLGLPVKLHAEQLSDLGGAALAASYNALSADHLEYVSEQSVKAMARAGTVAVLLPGAFYFLRETKKPPIDLFKRHGVPMAISTDSNPGSSPCASLLLMMNMACTFFALTPEESLKGVTLNGAAALGLDQRIGSLEVGKQADLALWDLSHPAELSYRFGFNPLNAIVKDGRQISF